MPESASDMRAIDANENISHNVQFSVNLPTNRFLSYPPSPLAFIDASPLFPFLLFTYYTCYVSMGLIKYDNMPNAAELLAD